jgi:ribosome-binding factor A
MSTTFRPERVAEAVHEAVARVLNREVSDPRLRAVTITRCEITHDLSYAKIYYTVLGDDEARLDAARAFERATPFLRSRVGQEVALRTVPELSFRYDKGTENAMRIEEILSNLPELNSEGETQSWRDEET